MIMIIKEELQMKVEL